MKILRLAALGVLCLSASSPVVSQTSAPKPLLIVIAGDSTVCNYNLKRPDRGWGMYLEEQFKTGTVEVTNLATPGRSTKTFINEGRWAKALAEKPDFILIQFGHNDSHDPRNREATDFATDYKANLRQFIDDARAIGATPILVTPMVRRDFDAQGKIVDAAPPSRPLSAYAKAMKEVAAEKHIPVIDLYSSSLALVEKLGPAESATLANQKGDITHFNEKGARAMAALLVEGLPAAEPKLAACLKAQSQQGAGQPPAKESFHIYLLMGQSNMAGRGKITPDTQKIDSRVLTMIPEGQWAVAKDPLHEQVGRTEPGVGPGMTFALEMLKTDPQVTIGLVPCAVGGTPLKRWVKGGDLYEKAVKRARLAAQTGTLSGVLWHQGEADTDKQPLADSYEARLSQMIKDLRQDLGQPDLPVVVGQLGEFLSPEKHPYAETVRAALRHIPAVVPHGGCADSTGLQDKGDKLHFNADAQKEFGVRYAKAMQEAQK